MGDAESLPEDIRRFIVMVDDMVNQENELYFRFDIPRYYEYNRSLVEVIDYLRDGEEDDRKTEYSDDLEWMANMAEKLDGDGWQMRYEWDYVTFEEVGFPERDLKDLDLNTNDILDMWTIPILCSLSLWEKCLFW